MAESSKQEFRNKQRSQWQSHISAWKGSGLSRAAYCAQHVLKLQSFAYWRKRLKNRRVPLRWCRCPRPGTTHAGRSAAIRVAVDERYVIEVADGFNASTLTRVFDVVRGG